MKTLSKTLSLLILLSVSVLSANAQIKLESVGRFQVGPTPSSVITADAGNVLSMQLYGRETATGYGAGSKLAFGDFGLYSSGGWNVFIGEYGTTETVSLRSATDATTELLGIDLLDDSQSNAFLYQNVPNPFNSQTEIRYFLPEGVKDAYICVFNMQGALLKKLQINDKSGIVTLFASELNAGMYLYALIADGKTVDTKRMILTK